MRPDEEPEEENKLVRELIRAISPVTVIIGSLGSKFFLKMNERLVLGSSCSYSGTEEVIGHGLQKVGEKEQMGSDLNEIISTRGQREKQGIRRGGIVN